MGHMVLPLIDFNCQNLRKFIYKLSEHATALLWHDYEWELCGSANVDVWRLSDSLDPIKPKVVRAVLAQQLTCYLPIDFFLYLQCP